MSFKKEICSLEGGLLSCAAAMHVKVYQALFRCLKNVAVDSKKVMLT